MGTGPAAHHDTSRSVARSGISLWLDAFPGGEVVRRAPLPGDVDTDIAIVGGGFTGLWTAYYLRALAPDRPLMLIEAETAGFGASGRNGGWCFGELTFGLSAMLRRHGRKPTVELVRAAQASLDEIERVLTEEQIECSWDRSGAVFVARNEPQLARLRDWYTMLKLIRLRDWQLLDKEAVRARVAVRGALGGAFSPHCAAVQPARIARGLADAVSRRGAVIVEDTRALRIGPHEVRTDRGTVRARVVVLATEAFTGTVRGQARRVLPVYQHVIATEPLAKQTWAGIGWQTRLTVADMCYQYLYMQRTADDRIVVGGRTTNYHLGARPRAQHDRDERARDKLRRALVDIFPALGDVTVTQHWGGPFGLHRDLLPGVGYDASTGLAHAGGYGGEGLALSNLAGRTLAALITGADQPERRLCWVDHRSPRWEPEPLPFIVVRAVNALATSVDNYEERTGRPARIRSKILASFLGG
jgi:glycine/D-amino acid oxidase-like deaminating enzyme